MDARNSIVDLAAAGALNPRIVGTKAGVLGELAATGLPVPPGFVVSGAALAHHGDGGGVGCAVPFVANRRSIPWYTRRSGGR